MTDEYGAHLIDLLAPWACVTVRKMFGGLGLYRQGLIFAIVADDTLYFKVNDSNRADYEAEGCEPFTYRGKDKPVAMSYWRVPEWVIDESETLSEWAEKAYQTALGAKQKKSAKKKRFVSAAEVYAAKK